MSAANTRQRTERLKRREEMLQMRLEGWSQVRIAQHFGIAQPTVSKALKAALAAVEVECEKHAKTLHALEMQRLDEMWAAAWPLAQSGCEKMMAQCVRISERRCKLAGLDAPAKRESTVDLEIKSASELAHEQLRTALGLHGDDDTATAAAPDS